MVVDGKVCSLAVMVAAAMGGSVPHQGCIAAAPGAISAVPPTAFVATLLHLLTPLGPPAMCRFP